MKYEVLYEQNKDFKEYVDRISKTYNMPIDKVLKQKTVQIVGDYYIDND